MSAVWNSSEAKGTTRLVFLALADNARDDDGVAWPSVATLARKCRVDERTVQRAINQLASAEVCERCLGRTSLKPHKPGFHLNELAVEQLQGRSNRYRLIVPRTPGNLSPRQSVTPGNLPLTPGDLSPDPRQSVTSTPGNLPPKPLGNRQVTVKEPRRRSRRTDHDGSAWADQPTGRVAL